MASYLDTSTQGNLTPDDLGYFQVNRRRLQDSYNLNKAQNDFQKNSALSQYGRTRADMLSKFAKMRENLPSAAAHRGILNSGIQQRNVAQFENDADRQLSNLRLGFEDQSAGYNLAANQLYGVLLSGMNDIDTQEAARRATAAALRSGGV